MNDLLIVIPLLALVALWLLRHRVRDSWVDWRARRRGSDAERAHLIAERERACEELRRLRDE